MNINEQRLEYKSYYCDMLICLTATTILPLFMYGTRVIEIVLVALATSLITDSFCVRVLRKRHYEYYDYSWAVTAMIFASLVPVTVPYWVVVVGVSFANLIVKHPFGGEGKHIFPPSAVGLAFCILTWPEHMLKYPTPFSTITGQTLSYQDSPASIMAIGGTPSIDLLEGLLGWYVGPLGATSLIIITTCLFFLVIRRRASFLTVSFAILMVSLGAIYFPRTSTTDWQSVLFEMCCGAFYFGLVFFTSDPDTKPKTPSGRILYGIFVGLGVVLYRHHGVVELEIVFVIILANVLAIPCDRYASHIRSMFKSKRKNKIEEIQRVELIDITNVARESNKDE